MVDLNLNISIVIGKSKWSKHLNLENPEWCFLPEADGHEPTVWWCHKGRAAVTVSC